MIVISLCVPKNLCNLALPVCTGSSSSRRAKPLRKLCGAPRQHLNTDHTPSNHENCCISSCLFQLPLATLMVSALGRTQPCRRCESRIGIKSSPLPGHHPGGRCLAGRQSEAAPGCDRHRLQTSSLEGEGSRETHRAGVWQLSLSSVTAQSGVLGTMQQV